MAKLGDELESLSALPGVSEVVLVATDGLLIASAGPSGDGADVAAALAPPVLSAATSFGNAAGVGGARILVSRCDDGVILVRPVGEEVILAVVADGSADVAHLLHEAREAAGSIEPLV